MKKILLSIFILLLVSVAACKQAAEKEVMEKKEEVMEKETPKVETTGNAAVDAVGNDLNSIASVEKDLSTDELNEIDSGLQDIQNI